LTDLTDFVNRVRKNARHWGRWARRNGIECYRIYDRDIPEFAFALDVYGDWAHLQEYVRRSEPDGPERRAWRAAAHAAVAQALEWPTARVVLKAREQRAGGQHEHTGRKGRDFIVAEQGHRFIVDLEEHLDTGLFLDHRITRALIEHDARGRRFLNLFCYTGGFTVYAAAGGATASTSIDLSNTYLDWARRNLELNGIDRETHALVRADVLRWLPQAHAAGERFDLIMLDPPVVSRSKAMAEDLDVQRDHAQLIAGCARLLTRNGILYFSTNLQRFKLAADAFSGLRHQEISQHTVPPDFRNRRIHRCWKAIKS